MASAEIHAVQTVSGNQPRARRKSEHSAQTFLPGTPVELSGGYVTAWDGTTVAFGIAGFSSEPASNLTTSGVAKTLTFGAVPYEPSAVNIPRGAPLNDGRCGFEVASQDTVFKGQVGPSQSVTIANVGIKYGLTIDSDGHWYVDLTNTSTPVVEIVSLDPQEAPFSTGTLRGVYFQVTPAATQLQA